MSLKNLLLAVALSLGVQTATAEPPAPARPDVPWIIKSSAQKESSEKNLTLTINLSFSDISPQYMEIENSDSILHEVDLETITLMTLGLSLDFDLYQQQLGSNFEFDLPLGIDVNFSSSKLFGEVIDDKGKINRSGIKADYTIEGKLNYFAFGVRLLPKIFYKNGAFRIGGTTMAGGGVNYVRSENNYHISVTNSETREILETANLNPDIDGQVNISGIGGFVQITTGPFIGIHDVICTYKFGIRYDLFNLQVIESSNSSLMGMGDKKYDAKYDDSSLVHNIGCGFEF